MIKQCKSGIGASILEGALYVDTPSVLLKSQGRLFLESLKYLAVSSTGLLALLVPVVLALGFASGLYGSELLSSNSSTLLTLETKTPKDLFLVSIKAPSEVNVSPVVKDLKSSKAFVRLDIDKCPQSPLSVNLGDSSFPLSLKCDQGKFIQPVILESGVSSFLYPGSISDSKSPLKSVTLEYPESNDSVHWLITFSIVSLISGFCGAKLFKIQL